MDQFVFQEDELKRPFIIFETAVEARSFCDGINYAGNPKVSARNEHSRPLKVFMEDDRKMLDSDSWWFQLRSWWHYWKLERRIRREANAPV